MRELCNPCSHTVFSFCALRDLPSSTPSKVPSKEPSEQPSYVFFSQNLSYVCAALFSHFDGLVVMFLLVLHLNSPPTLHLNNRGKRLSSGRMCKASALGSNINLARSDAPSATPSKQPSDQPSKQPSYVKFFHPDERFQSLPPFLTRIFVLHQ